MRKPWLDNLILESFAMNRHILLAYVCFFFARYVTDHPQAMVCHWGFLTSPENRGFVSKWNSPIVGQNSYMIYIYLSIYGLAGAFRCLSGVCFQDGVTAP